jgi:hypothetical protein
MKLTDSQLVILSSAANRDGGTLLPLPKSVKLNKGAATLVLKSLLKHKLVAEHPTAAETESWREDKQGQRFALTIAPAGLKAIGADEAAGTTPLSAERKSAAKDAKPATKARNAKPSAREGSKLSILIGLMSRKTGATIEEAAKATGWQHHSIRGAISGALKKKMGLEVASNAVDGRGRVYKIGGAS